MEMELQEAAGLVCVRASWQMTMAVLRNSVPMSWAISVCDDSRSASGGHVCSVPVSTLGGRERGRAVSSASWLAVRTGRRAPRESSTRMAVKIISDFKWFFVVDSIFCSVCHSRLLMLEVRI